jgi:hypothetical protein
MRRIAIALTIVAAAGLAVGVMAQGKQSFAGKWTLVPDPNAPAGGGGGRGGRGMGGGWGQEFTATQDANTLTIDYTAGGQNPSPVKVTYKLDGSESKNAVPGGRGGTTEQVSKATWDGNKLKIVTTISFQGNAFETTRVLSLEGGNLVIETTSPGFGGGAGQTTKATYKKS